MKRFLLFLFVFTMLWWVCPGVSFGLSFDCYTYFDKQECVCHGDCIWCDATESCQPKEFPCPECEEQTYLDCSNFTGCHQCQGIHDCRDKDEP